jgi:hypothetical protein
MHRLPEAGALVNDRDEHVPQPPRRGRPRKPVTVDRRCTDPFDTVAGEVANLAKSPEWNAAKERVRRWADRDRSLRPISTKVLGYYLEHLNRKKGYD